MSSTLHGDLDHQLQAVDYLANDVMATCLLIRQLKHEFSDLEKLWYADDVASAGRFDRIRAHFAIDRS